jgi:cytochrome c oxidase subunit 4
MATEAAHAAHDAGHVHPGWKTYLKIAVVLFVLTALEVLAYEIVESHSPAGLAQALEPVFVPVLLVLSAAKFALVAMFYMHLKMDGTLLSTIFAFSLVLAALVIVSLMILFAYLWAHSPTVNPLK